MTQCPHDMGFDNEIGPLGCRLVGMEMECVCEHMHSPDACWLVEYPATKLTKYCTDKHLIPVGKHRQARLLADRLRWLNNERVISLAQAQEICGKLGEIIFFLDQIAAQPKSDEPMGQS